MFGIGLPELIFILILALIVLGPEKLPQVAKQMARIVFDIKKAADEFKNQLDLEDLDDLTKTVENPLSIEEQSPPKSWQEDILTIPEENQNKDTEEKAGSSAMTTSTSAASETSNTADTTENNIDTNTEPKTETLKEKLGQEA